MFVLCNVSNLYIYIYIYIYITGKKSPALLVLSLIFYWYYIFIIATQQSYDSIIIYLKIVTIKIYRQISRKKI